MYLKGHSHGSILDQFQHHGSLTAATIKSTNIVVFCRVNTPAVLGNATRRVLPDIGKARLVHNAKVLNILPNQVREPTITTLTERGEC